ncbi:hypothetical protein RYD26_12345 [Pasteurellaceae bacterium LIM206]|nr:hypothetical protein [Pasteurellaceae bacterium LIM206]
MLLQETLKKFVDIFHKDSGLGKLEYSSEKLLDNSTLELTGEIKEFYQHLSFERKCYFTGSPYDIALIPSSLLGKAIEGWQDLNWNSSYVIFAHLMGDEPIFCDMNNNYCPVYGIFPGDPKLYKLSDSLNEFLLIYIKLKEIEINLFNNNVYTDENFSNYKENYVSTILETIKNNVPKELCDDFREFMFG